MAFIDRLKLDDLLNAEIENKISSDSKNLNATDYYRFNSRKNAVPNNTAGISKRGDFDTTNGVLRLVPCPIEYYPRRALIPTYSYASRLHPTITIRSGATADPPTTHFLRCTDRTRHINYSHIEES